VLRHEHVLVAAQQSPMLVLGALGTHALVGAEVEGARACEVDGVGAVLVGARGVTGLEVGLKLHLLFNL
jgi:hypothetical protein